MDKDYGPKAGNCRDHHIRRLACAVVLARRLESRRFNWGVDNHLTTIVDNVSPKMFTFIKGLFAGLTNLLIGSIIAGKRYPLQSIGVALLVGMEQTEDASSRPIVNGFARTKFTLCPQKSYCNIGRFSHLIP